MFELSLLCPQAQVEIVSDALEALEAQSVSVEDSDALTDTEQPLFGEPGMVPTQIGWRHSTVKALFATEALAQEAADPAAGAGLLRRMHRWSASHAAGRSGLGAPDPVAVRTGADQPRTSGSCRPGTSRRPMRNT